MRRTTARVLPVVVLTGLMAGTAASAVSAHPAAHTHRPHARQPGVGIALPAALPTDCGPNGTDVCPAPSGPSGPSDPFGGAFLGGAPGAPTPDLALPGAPQDPVPRDTPADDPFRIQSPPPQAPYRDPLQDQAAPRDPSSSRTPSRGQGSGGPSRDDGPRDSDRGQASRDPGRDTGAGHDPSRDGVPRDPSRDGVPRDSSRDGVPRDPDRFCANPADRNCAGGAARHGVHAGAGGAFTTSLPALVAGGLLIAAALGAAVHRVWWRRKD